MLKQISKLKGFQKLEKKTLLRVNGAGPKLCNASCNYNGQRCYSNGHCGCPGVCTNHPGGGLACLIY